MARKSIVRKATSRKVKTKSGGTKIVHVKSTSYRKQCKK